MSRRKMDPRSIQKRLCDVVRRMGWRADLLACDIGVLAKKLLRLQETGRHSGLVSALLSCNDINNFNSLAVEATFAFAFEAQGHPLLYEVTQELGRATSIDFLRKAQDGRKIYLELRVVQQRNAITKDIQAQLAEKNTYLASLDAAGEQNEVIRLQRNILAKCQDENGKPIKFFRKDPGVFNIIVVEVSEVCLGCIDEEDCRLVAYGDPSAHRCARRRIFGLFQEPLSSYPNDIQEIAQQFCHFRQTIHGIMFLKKDPSYKKLNFELQYLLAPNESIVRNEDAELISDEVRQALGPWNG